VTRPGHTQFKHSLPASDGTRRYRLYSISLHDRCRRRFRCPQCARSRKGDSRGLGLPQRLHDRLANLAAHVVHDVRLRRSIASLDQPSASITSRLSTFLSNRRVAAPCLPTPRAPLGRGCPSWLPSVERRLPPSSPAPLSGGAPHQAGACLRSGQGGGIERCPAHGVDRAPLAVPHATRP
jgi:hypothetical protein